MKTKIKVILLSIVIFGIFPIISLAIVEVDNGIMKIYNPGDNGFEYDCLRAFDINGYIEDSTQESGNTLISSTFGNQGYHTFLNVNGTHGEMNQELAYIDQDDLEAKLKAMQYTAYDVNNEWQTIDGINLKVSTKFINNGEQLQIIYDLKNTTSTSANISLATTADVQIDGDDSATIERLDDESGVRLWTKEGITDKPVQFVFYGKNVNGATNVDNLWIGGWNYTYFQNMFTSNSDITKIENQDSAFSYSWSNKTINAGETQTYSVLMEVGEINIPNTGITLDDNTKFYYSDVKINGTVNDKDLKDKITIHYEVDGTEYTLPEMQTTGTAKNFSLDLTLLNLSAVTPHTLKVWATDSTDCSSNVEERTFTITYLKNPTITLSEKEWTKNDVTYRITDTDNVQQYVSKYQCRINNGEWTDCTKDTDNIIGENGVIQVDVRIVGTQTGDYSDIITDYAKIDKVNPTSTVPIATKTTCSITVISEQTDEHSGIDSTKTQYAIKTGSTWGEWQSSNVFTGLTHNTDYIVKTKSTDKVGNSSESTELTVKTDELLLGGLILKLNSNEGLDYTEDTWTNQSIYIAIQEKSEGATTKYKSKEGSAKNIVETNQETTVIESGITILLLSVTDGTNVITSEVEHILKIDKIAPVINELSLDNNEWTTSEKNITGKAIDELSGINAYQFSNQDDITITSTGWNSINVSNSEIKQSKSINENGKIYFYVKDVAGNIAVINIDTKIDGQGPVITFEKSNGKTSINVADVGSGVKNIKYVWTTEETEPSNEEWNDDYTEAVTYKGESKGKIFLWAKAMDNIDNITIEHTAFNSIKNPKIVSEDKFINSYASFKLNSDNEDNDVIYQFNIDDGEWKDISKDSEYTISNIAEGNINIKARVLDNAGRYSDVVNKVVNVVFDSESQADGNNNSDSNNDDNDSSDDGTYNTDTTIYNSKHNDGTISNANLPYTGIKRIIFASVIIMLCISIILYVKVKNYKDIK